MNERLNSVNIPNYYFHESWGEKVENHINKIKMVDTVIILSLNAQSHVASNYIKKMINSKNVKKILILSSVEKIFKSKKITNFSLNKINKNKYDVETFEGYNDACAKMINFIVDMLKIIHKNKK